MNLFKIPSKCRESTNTSSTISLQNLGSKTIRYSSLAAKHILRSLTAMFNNICHFPAAMMLRIEILTTVPVNRIPDRKKVLRSALERNVNRFVKVTHSFHLLANQVTKIHFSDRQKPNKNAKKNPNTNNSVSETKRNKKDRK